MGAFSELDAELSNACSDDEETMIDPEDSIQEDPATPDIPGASKRPAPAAKAEDEDAKRKAHEEAEAKRTKRRRLPRRSAEQNKIYFLARLCRVKKYK